MTATGIMGAKHAQRAFRTKIELISLEPCMHSCHVKYGVDTLCHTMWPM